jgi:protein-serine/threonine kinase
LLLLPSLPWLNLYWVAYDARLVDIWACGIVYYCLHFQELPWRAAQPGTDPLYASYAKACQASPSSKDNTANANSHSTSNGSSSTKDTTEHPPTIQNLSPKPCRPLIRKMLEPDPRLRMSIEEVVDHAWVQSIEVCHDVPNPRHVHSCARELGMAYADKLH